MPDSGRMDLISKLHEVDPVFREVVGMLFGDAVDPRELYDISKLNDSSELHVNKPLSAKKDKRRRKITAGLSATGAAAGVAGLAYGAKDMYDATKKSEKVKLRTKALIPLEIAGLGGELMATHILHGDTKKKPPQPTMGAGLSKQLAEGVAEIVKARKTGQISLDTALRMSEQLLDSVNQTLPLPPQPVAKRLVPVQEPVAKADSEVDYGFTGEISKLDSDKRLAFGWCSLSTMDGEPVVDLQGDYAPIDEIEKSAYAYVTSSRVGGDMHTREGEAPRHTSDLVESFIATPDKLQQMGLSEEVAKSIPTGWWVGFKVNDDEQWAMVKDGRRAGFSIHGKGSRVQKALD